MQSTPIEPTPRGVAERPPSVRYLGFQNTEEGRTYRLRVDSGGNVRMVTVTIPHTAFQSKKARFQDAPELCFAKLQRELATQADLPDGLQLMLSTDELEEWRDAQARRVPERKKRRPALP